MRVAVVAILAIMTTLFTVAPSGVPNEAMAGSVIRSSLNGEPVRLTLPTGTGAPKGLVVWFHGQGGNVNDRIDSPWLSSLVRDGFALASSNFHLQAWGNAATTDDTVRLVEWAQEQIDVPVVLWVSGSMGGATSLNALVAGVEPPPCWYGVKPAISLKNMGAVPKAPRLIDIAYRGGVPIDRNPVRNFDVLPSGIRYRVVASPDDQWVPINQNGGALVSSLNKRGVDVTYLLANGPHEDPSHWNSTDLLQFANSCVGDGDVTRSAAAP